MPRGSIPPDDRKIVLLDWRPGGDEAVGTFSSLAANDAVAGIGPVAVQRVALKPAQDPP